MNSMVEEQVKPKLELHEIEFAKGYVSNNYNISFDHVELN